MKLDTCDVRGTNCSAFALRWLLLVPATLILAAFAIFLASECHITSMPATGHPGRTAMRGTHYFGPGHAEADVRTLAAMLRYLVSPDSALPTTNQLPVNS